MSGGKELGRSNIGGLERVQGRDGGGAGRQCDDKALYPVVGGRWRDGRFAKVLVEVAGPVEADDAKLFTLCESAELAWITSAA